MSKGRDAGRVAATEPGGTVQSATVKFCACGHDEQTHEHYRVGNDCGICGRSGCNRYLHRVEWIRLHRWFRTEPDASVPQRPDLRLVK